MPRLFANMNVRRAFSTTREGFMFDRRTFVTSSLAFVAVSAGAQQQERRFRLANGYKSDSFQSRNLADFAAALTSSGIPVELHADNTLFKLSEIPNAVRDGKAELGQVIMSDMVKADPLSAADNLPFIVRTYADAKRLWLYQKPLVTKTYEQIGLTPLMAVPWPAQCLYTKKPIESLAQLAGLKMRTAGPSSRRLANMLGAKPVEVAMVDVGKALAAGDIEMMITSGSTGVDNRVWTGFKYFTEINAWMPKNVTFANSKWFTSLNEKQRDEFRRTAAFSEIAGWNASEIAATDSIKELAKNGMRIEKPSPQLLADMKRLGERVALEWVGQVGHLANSIFVPYYAA
jgi:TRAP-type C4-dicarboxylate transport system substrate-binding protein